MKTQAVPTYDKADEPVRDLNDVGMPYKHIDDANDVGEHFSERPAVSTDHANEDEVESNCKYANDAKDINMSARNDVTAKDDLEKEVKSKVTSEFRITNENKAVDGNNKATIEIVEGKILEDQRKVDESIMGKEKVPFVENALVQENVSIVNHEEK